MQQIVFLALCSSMVICAKYVTRFDLRVPGNTGMLWMAVMVVAKSVVPAPGSASLVGLVAGIIATLLGMGKEGLLVWTKYAAPGLLLDALWPVTAGVRQRLPRAVAIGLVAAVAHTGKLGASYVAGLLLHVPRHFLVLGLQVALLFHLLFGFIGGAVGSELGARVNSLLAARWQRSVGRT